MRDYDPEIWHDWAQRGYSERPEPIAEVDLNSLLEVIAFIDRAVSPGFAVRLKMSDGTKLGLRLNPVVARNLAFAILDVGQRNGWLDEGHDLVIPDEPSLNS